MDELTVTNPKKPFLGKRNKKPNYRQKLWVQKLAEGMTPAQATEIVYKPNSPDYRNTLTYRLQKSQGVRELMANAHLDENKVVATITEALDAVSTWETKSGGEVSRPNWAARLKAAELSLKMMGYLDAGKHEGSSTPPEIKVQFIKIDEKAKVKTLKEFEVK